MRSFDLVFSADVLEHVHEDEAEQVIAELVRVSRRHLFLSISLKPHTKARDSPDNCLLLRLRCSVFTMPESQTDLMALSHLQLHD